MVSLEICFVEVHSLALVHYCHQCQPHLREQLWSLWPHHSGALQWYQEATSAYPHLLPQ